MRVAFLACALAAVPALAEEAQIRDAANRAIELLQSSQKKWNQDCSSCHHQFQPAIAFRDARSHGLKVDEAIARVTAQKAFDYHDLDRAVQYNYVIEPAMDDAYRLVAAAAAGVRPNLVTAIYARLLASRQDPAGHWDSFHQRPPSSYSRFTQTALASRAVALYTHPDQRPEALVHLVRARAWFQKNKPRDTEERSYQLMGLRWTGADREIRVKAGAELLATQQPDGGWNSVDGRASDAYSTGEALVALADFSGVATSDARWRKGIQFLLHTQAPDGSWH